MEEGAGTEGETGETGAVEEGAGTEGETGETGAEVEDSKAEEEAGVVAVVPEGFPEGREGATGAEGEGAGMEGETGETGAVAEGRAEEGEGAGMEGETGETGAVAEGRAEEGEAGAVVDGQAGRPRSWSIKRHQAREQPVLKPPRTKPRCFPFGRGSSTLKRRWRWSGIIATRHTFTIG